MSNFNQQAVNPHTGQVEMAEWLDDYFGKHVYGVRFPSGEIFCENQVRVAGEQANQLGPKELDELIDP